MEVRSQQDISQYWPELDTIIRIDKVHYHMPILITTAMFPDMSPEFPFFDKYLYADEIWNVCHKEQMDHDAYLSAYFLRLFIDNAKVYAGYPELRTQYERYKQHLPLILSFLKAQTVMQRKEHNVFKIRKVN